MEGFFLSFFFFLLFFFFFLTRQFANLASLNSQSFCLSLSAAQASLKLTSLPSSLGAKITGMSCHTQLSLNIFNDPTQAHDDLTGSHQRFSVKERSLILLVFQDCSYTVEHSEA